MTKPSSEDDPRNTEQLTSELISSEARQWPRLIQGSTLSDNSKEEALKTALEARAGPAGGGASETTEYELDEHPAWVAIEKKYDPIYRTGTGKMGSVWVVRDKAMKRTVALKVLHPLLEKDAVALAQFRLEASIPANLGHRGIIKIHTLEQQESGSPFYTMPMLSGPRTLRDELRGCVAEDYRERLHLVEMVARISEAMAYAHGRGIVHRDLKPENTLLSSDGEVLVIDWGISHVNPRDVNESDVPSLELVRIATSEKVRDHIVRFSTEAYRDPASLGRPTLRLEAVSDVYALGVMLHEAALAERPLTDTRNVDVAVLAQKTWPPEMNSLPVGLAAVIGKALERDAHRRFQNAGELNTALREWMSRDAEARLHEASLAIGDDLLDKARTARGASRADFASRAMQATRDVPSTFGGIDQQRQGAAELMAAGQSQAKRATVVRVAAALGLVIGVVAWWAYIESKRAETNRDLVERGLEPDRLGDLIERAADLWPGAPEAEERMSAWIREAEALRSTLDIQREDLRAIERRGKTRVEDRPVLARAVRDKSRFEQSTADIEAALRNPDSLRLRSDMAPEKFKSDMKYRLDYTPPTEDQTLTRWTFGAADDALRHQSRSRCLAQLAALDDGNNGGPGLLTRVQRRRATFDAQRSDATRSAWDAALLRMAQNPRYAGLALKSVPALLPLGPDPALGLEEFHVYGTGIPARRDEDGTLEREFGYGIILVLIPGGAYRQGSAPADVLPGDKLQLDETPQREVEIGPYFLGKYEVSQEQWATLTEGLRPSFFDGRRGPSGLSAPVEQVSWFDCETWLDRYAMRMPTEAEWEHACRAGTQGVTYFPDGDGYPKHGNFADKTLQLMPGPPEWSYNSDLDDGHDRPTEGGQYKANPFGLHDMLGNVGEWCFDYFCWHYYSYGRREDPMGSRPIRPRFEVVYRGGSYRDTIKYLRCADRRGSTRDARTSSRGVRAAMSVPMRD